MKSKTSLFNKGISKSLIKRYWPIWAGYMAALILVLPVNVYNLIENQAYYEGYVQRNPNGFVMDSAGIMIAISFFAGIIFAMAVFGDLYKSRTCGMISALPVKRECLFLTAYLTAVLTMILADVLTVGITALLYLADAYYLMLWLGVAVMTNIIFFSFASLCAVLTGSLIILPAVYVVLNLTSLVVEECISGILEKTVFGFTGHPWGFWASWLSPIGILEGSYVSYVNEEGAVVYEGMGVMAVYFVLSLIIAALALIIFKRRHMESAGDVVAVKCLKPIFKYCMSFGTALVLAYLLSSMLPETTFYGLSGAALMLLLMLLGAVIGFFGAEMMMQKSFRVFNSKWKGLIVVCLVLTVFMGGFEFDLFGYESRIPDTEDVEWAMLWGNEINEPEAIEELTEIHRDILGEKDKKLERKDQSFINISYSLKNGKELRRQYRVECTEASSNDPESLICRVHDILNRPEILLENLLPDFEPTKESFVSAYLYMNYVNEDGIRVDDTKRLTPDQALEFYTDCILPDIKDGHLGLRYPAYSTRNLDELTNISIGFDLVEFVRDEEGRPQESGWSGIYDEVRFDSERCLKWIEENTDFVIQSQRQLYGEEGKAAAAFGRNGG